ncbi:hypothetical protein BHM03_00060392 [Ensete ventricosum]|nr:hypothetical protein BHM03_00060392 [Ensete ventricosum]
MTDGGPGDDGTFHEMIANGLRSGHIPSTRFLGEMPSFRAAFVKKEVYYRCLLMSPVIHTLSHLGTRRVGKCAEKFPLVCELELSRMSRAPGSGLGGRLLEWWSSGRVEVSQLGSRCDPSDGQVSFVVDFTIPSLRRGAGAFITTVTGYPYLNLLSSLLLTIPLHLTMSSVVLAARRAPAADG